MKKAKEIIKELATMMGIIILSCGAYCMPAFAGGLAENAAKAAFNEMFWVVLIVTLCVAVFLFFKRNYTKMATTLIVGGILCFIIEFPTIIAKLGEYFGNQIFEGM